MSGGVRVLQGYHIAIAMGAHRLAALISLALNAQDFMPAEVGLQGACRLKDFIDAPRSGNNPPSLRPNSGTSS